MTEDTTQSHIEESKINPYGIPKDSNNGFYKQNHYNDEIKYQMNSGPTPTYNGLEESKENDYGRSGNEESSTGIGLVNASIY